MGRYEIRGLFILNKSNFSVNYCYLSEMTFLKILQFRECHTDPVDHCKQIGNNEFYLHVDYYYILICLLCN